MRREKIILPVVLVLISVASMLLWSTVAWGNESGCHRGSGPPPRVSSPNR